MQKKAIIAIGIGIGLSLFILLASQLTVFSASSGFFQKVASSPKAALYSFKSSSDQSGELQKLKKENQELQKKLIGYDKMKRENEALKSQFEMSNEAQSNVLPARVVGSMGSPSEPHTLIIDKGRNHGIKENMSVVIGKNLVGKIGQVDPEYAEVMLVINPKFSTISLTNENKTKGIIKGYEDFMILDQVVITDTIKKGDLVVSRGSLDSEGRGVEPDLIIGKITDVNRNSREPFQTAQVKSQLDFGNINYVFINQ